MGKNVFLTGEPGAGKSYTVNAYVAYLRAHGVEVAVTASTGIAATHIGGMTIHSWSGIGIKKTLNRHELAEIVGRDKLVKRIKTTQVLIIDEISMLDGFMLSAVDAVCKAVRNSWEPFGGLQIIFVGDFFQLPPVARDGDEVMFSFASRAWREAAPTVCYLSEQHRQEDQEFLAILSAVRLGEVSAEHRQTLLSRKSKVEGEITKLFSHNADVDRINAGELAKLPGQAVTLTMRHQGAKPLVEQLMRGCLSPEKLVLKVGAKVMFTKNNPEKGFVNGTTGTVESFQKGSNYPVVKLRSGRTIIAEPMDWSVIIDGSPAAMIFQVPLRLAWAMTVHKSQGMSLDSAYVDLSTAFVFGQGYVALSRVRALSGLFLGGLNERSLQVDPQVLECDQEFREQSYDAQQSVAAMSTEERTKIQEDFLLRHGGRLETSTTPVASTSGKKASKETNEHRWLKTLEYILAGKSLAETAKARGRTIGTIVEHLQGLKDLGKLPMEKIRHIFEGDARELVEIHIALAMIGGEALKPIFEKFAGKYSYDMIRTAKLFYRER